MSYPSRPLIHPFTTAPPNPPHPEPHAMQVDLTEFEEPDEDGGSDGALWSEEEDFF